MILPLLIIIPFAGGLLAWVVARESETAARWVALVATLAQGALAVGMWIAAAPLDGLVIDGAWLAETHARWIPQVGISFHLGIDGISLLLVLLTSLLGAVSIVASWREVDEAVGLFHLHLMLVLTGVTGVFLALDMFLFYLFWELMLIPMYFLIDLWGHEDRHYAAVKFFIFTQLGGLLMLVGILGLVFVHHSATGVVTFDYLQLLGTGLGPRLGMALMLAFFTGLAFKLPAVPLHVWLPDAHTQAPTAGSVLLAGLLLKTGAYGMIRFLVPLFPDAAIAFSPVAMWLGVAGIIYGALLAFGQTDLKRLVAYTSISHLGFVLLGVFAWNRLALQGAVMQMLCHGVSTGALFVIAGSLQERLGTRSMAKMGGLWSRAPRIGGVAMFFALASLGLPGMGNFIGEFLVLVGTWSVNVAAAAVAILGLVASAVYALVMMEKVFFGEIDESERSVADFGGREMVVMSVMMAVIIWLGLMPQPVLDTSAPAVQAMQRSAAGYREGRAEAPSRVTQDGAETVRIAEVEDELR